MHLYALELSLDVIVSVRPLLPAIRRHSAKLATEIHDAASSVSLNLGEGHRRQGRDRLHFWRIASGSAEEVRTALRVVAAWGYVTEDRAAEALDRVDHVQAVLWKLLR